jgi:type III secretory pathway lipoprotein EscJ
MQTTQKEHIHLTEQEENDEEKKKKKTATCSIYIVFKKSLDLMNYITDLK